ncbi:hypothetical protein F383_06669 [Gossypium arboreum]|uniref:Uncharacterized protein n=1 Tax=Gossypium arboreum TaxID=29729 RepID=A0A0B0MSZ7_GOSAR|nr:hypothetical protein F383_06669 [Gossypium arboreum]
MPRPNLNVLLPQPQFPINRPDEIILIPNNFRDPYLSSDDSDRYESDEYFGDEDSEDSKQEKVVKPLTDNNLWSMMGDLKDDLEEHIDVLL